MTIVYESGKTEKSVINRFRKKGFVVTTIRRLDDKKFQRKDIHNYCIHYHKRRK